MDYCFFLDETGDHGLTFIDDNFPIFLLCGCLIREDNLFAFEDELNKFKKSFFGTTEVNLHSREIRKCDGAFQILFDLELKAGFYEKLNRLLNQTKYYIIGAGVNKKEHIKRYGKGAKDPYALSLSFILERLIFCLDRKADKSHVKISAEKRGHKEDQMLLAHYNSVIDRGTYYVSSARFEMKIEEFKFHSKRENIVGLQLADLCAYPLARYVINPDAPYIPFNVIQKKIYSDNKGNIDGWGLKMFP